MQNVSKLWQDITAGRYETQVRLLLAGQVIPEDDIFQLHTSQQVFGSSLSIGNAVCGEIQAEFLEPEFLIPRMAEIVPQIRVTDGTRTAEWIDHGHFFLDTRKKSHLDGLPTLEIEGYDAMLKAGADCPLFDIPYPAIDLQLVQLIARSMGVKVDRDTVELINQQHVLGFTEGYSKREVLSGIAAMYGGTFLMSPEGRLRLLDLQSIPAPTNYLITAAGNAITFGGVRILV